jgi:hypothetical protein
VLVQTDERRIVESRDALDGHPDNAEGVELVEKFIEFGAAASATT